MRGPPTPGPLLGPGGAAVELVLGRHSEAHGRLSQALDGLDDPASADAAALQIDLAVDAFYRMEYDGMAAWGERAVATADPLGDEPLTAAAAAIAAFAYSCTGPITEARAAGINSTPTFVLNGQPIVGLVPYQDLAGAISALAPSGAPAS